MIKQRTKKICLFFYLLKEGPHSTLKEDEFFDAIDQSLDRIDRETDDFQRIVSTFSFIHSLFIQNQLSVSKIRIKCIKLCARKKKKEKKKTRIISFILFISPELT